jgi:Fur family peroxide stress response transcriptional regulator
MIKMNRAGTSSDEFIINALRRKGYKATSQRVSICRFALSSREHPNAKRIYMEVKKEHPTVSLATVYKTLQVLKELRLVQELAFANSDSRFDSYMKPHLNIVCLRCGTINDVDDRIARDTIARASATARFTVTDQRLDIYGICEKCRKKIKPNA